MKILKIKLLIIMLYMITNLHAQLNEFMIQWYFYEDKTEILTSRLPWSNYNYDDFFCEMKNTYHFNTVYFETHVKNNEPTIWEKNFIVSAKNKGLKSIISCSPLFSWKKYYASPSSFNINNAQYALDYYSPTGDENSMIGYNIIDEPLVRDLSHNIFYNPKTKHYDTIANVIEDIPDYSNLIRKHNPSLLRWSNLACLWFQLNPDHFYRNKYIQEYINTSKPNILSFDQYPIEHSDSQNIQINFFKTLYDFAMKSVENAIPFIYVLTPFKYVDTEFYNSDVIPTPKDDVLEAKSIPEFKYVIYSALVYGAKGIAYWPGFQWVIDENLYPFKLKYDNQTLNYLKDLHEKLLMKSNKLLSLNFLSIYHKSFKSTTGSPHNEQIHDFCSWDNIAKDRYAQQIFHDPSNPLVDLKIGVQSNWSNYPVPDDLCISFMTDSCGKIYFWLFNKNLKYAMRFNINTKDNGVGIKDVLNGKTILSNPYPYVHLEPGEAKLFTFDGALGSQINYTINNKVYDGINPISGEDHFYAFETANQITLRGNVKFEANSTKSFMANQIILDTGVAIYQGSTIRLRAYTDSNTKNNALPPVPKYKQAIESEEKVIIKPQVYPNPIKDDFVLKIPFYKNDKIEIYVYDNIGRMIKLIKTESEVTNISLGNMPRGVYFVCFSQNNQAYSFKIIKL